MPRGHLSTPPSSIKVGVMEEKSSYKAYALSDEASSLRFTSKSSPNLTGDHSLAHLNIL